VPSQLAPNKDWRARSAWAQIKVFEVRSNQVSCAFRFCGSRGRAYHERLRRALVSANRKAC
jgi:hypothetical protein